MNQVIFKGSILILLIFSLAFSLDKARAFSGTPETNLNDQQVINTRKLDKEAEILSKYLAKHNSPLQYNAQDFVDAAKEYDLDWRLLPAIAGVESTFGKFTPGGYNGWGWGVYGTQAIYFKSWKEGIYTVSKGLRENYIDRGYTEPYSMNRAYAASPYWGGKVIYFMNDIERFAKRVQPVADIRASQLKIAAISGKLAL